MQPLDYPDIHFLNAASGWAELGRTQEARTELGKISLPSAGHPDVLEVRWQIYSQEKQWESALEVAHAVIKLAPERSSGWINQSYSLHEMNRTLEAWNNLLPVASKFPDVSTIPYNLACYACRLGNPEQAQSWLEKAIRVQGKEKIKALALGDQDLKPLWDKISKL